MKKMFISAIAFCAMAFSSAQAAPLADSFVSGNGASVAGTANAIRVTKGSGSVIVTHEDVVCSAACGVSPTVQTIPDANGAFWNSFVAQAGTNGWYRNGSANDFYSAKRARLVQCIGGTFSQFAYQSTLLTTSADSCAAFNAVKAASNQ